MMKGLHRTEDRLQRMNSPREMRWVAEDEHSKGDE